MLRWLLFVLAIGMALVAALILIPEPVLSRYEKDWAALTPSERFELQNQVRAGVLQTFGALLVLAGALTGVRQLGLSREQNELDRRAKLADSFSRAIEQVGSKDDASAVAGLYALERIGGIEPEQGAPILDIISTFLRTGDGARSLPVLNAGVRVGAKFATESQPLNLEGAVLANADLCGLQLPGTRFAGADLRDANFKNANLKGADFSQCDLSRCNFEGADLSCATFEGARILGAKIGSTTTHGPGSTS